MKRIIKGIICIAFCMVTIISLVACGSSEEKLKSEVIGEWTGKMTYSSYYVNRGFIDFEANCKLTVNSDGTFKIIATDGEDAKTINNRIMKGEWEIFDGKVHFYLNVDGGSSTSFYGDSLYISAYDINIFADKDAPNYVNEKFNFHFDKKIS